MEVSGCCGIPALAKATPAPGAVQTCSCIAIPDLTHPTPQPGLPDLYSSLVSSSPTPPVTLNFTLSFGTHDSAG